MPASTHLVERQADPSRADGGSGPASAYGGAEAPAGRWVRVCQLDDIVPDTGVAALIDGAQIAVVRVGDGDDLYGISNYDPFSHAFVISRGIVGDRGGRPKIASPIFKHNFDLATGACLDDPKVTLATYPVRVRDGVVEVSVDSAAARPPGEHA